MLWSLVAIRQTTSILNGFKPHPIYLVLKPTDCTSRWVEARSWTLRGLWTSARMSDAGCLSLPGAVSSNTSTWPDFLTLWEHIQEQAAKRARQPLYCLFWNNLTFTQHHAHHTLLARDKPLRKPTWRVEGVGWESESLDITDTRVPGKFFFKCPPRSIKTRC